MGPQYVYKDMLDNVVSPIAYVSMNHLNQLEQMAYGAMFATEKQVWHLTIYSEKRPWYLEDVLFLGNKIWRMFWKGYETCEGLRSTNSVTEFEVWLK
jgi:hypothetical protein